MHPRPAVPLNDVELHPEAAVGTVLADAGEAGQERQGDEAGHVTGRAGAAAVAWYCSGMLRTVDDLKRAMAVYGVDEMALGDAVIRSDGITKVILKTRHTEGAFVRDQELSFCLPHPDNAWLREKLIEMARGMPWA